MEKALVGDLINESLKQYPDLFLIDFNLGPSNEVRVTIDGDRAVSIDDCTNINRDLEQRLDLEEEDFSVEVSSVGITKPLLFPRQFKKNIGRKLKVLTAGQKYKAELTKVDDSGITLTWKQREIKPVGKGKHTVKKEVTLEYHAITKANVVITFNK